MRRLALLSVAFLAGPAIAGALTGTLPHGDGHVRVVLAHASALPPGATHLAFDVHNEGCAPFRLTGKERWAVRDASGREVVLGKPRGKLEPVEPGEIVTLALPVAGPLDAIVAASLDGRELRDPWTEPALLARVAPVEPRRAVPRLVRLTVRVDAQGRVTLPGGPGKDEAVRAVREAVARWTFAPARAGGTPVPSLHVVSVALGRTRVARTVVPVPAEALHAWLAAALSTAGGPVVDVPSRNAFAWAGRPSRRDGMSAVRLTLIRHGDAGGGRSWITVGVIAHFQGSAACPYAFWTAQEAVLDETVAALRTGLGVAAESPAYLGAVTPLDLPSGDEDAVGELRWPEAALRRFAEAVLASSGALPTGEELGTPVPVDVDTDGLEMPRLVEKVEPQFPRDQLGENDKVRILATIGTDGRPGGLVVLDGREPSFVHAAARAVACWRYTPARRAGEPVPVPLTISVAYSSG